MKNKGSIIFIICIIVIIIGYYIFIKNINYFLPTYEDGIKELNDVYKSDFNADFFPNLYKDEPSSWVARGEDYHDIIKNDQFLNFLEFMAGSDYKGDISKMVKEKFDDKNVVVFDSSYYSSLVIYFPDFTEGTILAFTPDLKNLVYRRYLNGEYCANYNTEIKDLNSEEKIKKIKQIINKEMEKSGYDFEVTSINKSTNTDYGYKNNELYYIRDTKHDIYIEYNYYCNKVVNLTIGFVK